MNFVFRLAVPFIYIYIYITKTIIYLASEDGRSRRRVRCRHGVVNIDHQARVRRLIRTRERDEVRRRLAPAARHRELGARDVRLGAAGGAGAVESDVLDAQQVVARGDARRDLGGHATGALARPGQATAANGRPLREDLEPDRARAVPRVGRLPRRRLRHVELQDPRVRDRRVRREAYRVAGGYRHRLGAFVAGR